MLQETSLNTSESFLSHFNHKIYTLCYLHPSKGMRSFPSTPEKLPKALDFLQKQNKESEIYFMVNEGNGKMNASNTACHSSVNVTNLSAIFLDAELTDGTDPFDKVISYCSLSFVEPSLMVKTSKNRYHIYWLLDANTESTPQNIIKWKKIQSYLHSKLSSDRTMTDLPQVLRIPGFKNLKKDYLVKTIHTGTSPSTYSLTELYKTLSNGNGDLDSIPIKQPLPLLTETYIVDTGERHEEILRRARKLYSIDSLSDEDIVCFIDGFIQNHVSNPSVFLKNGKRREEVERTLRAAKGYANEEKLKQVSLEITKHVEIKNKNKSPFELDPEFFYNAPGIVGDITRYIVNNSDYPIPAHAFAAAISLVGFTKCRYIQGHRNLPPLNYFLCLAPAGSGKTSIEHILKRLMTKLQIGTYLEDGIASAQGLIQFLTTSNGQGIIIYDEVKDLFQTISSKRAATHELKIATELTKLYTAYGSDYRPPTTKTQKQKPVILKKPLFSFLGFGHHNLIKKMFTKDNVLEGLLPRFIVLNTSDRTESLTAKDLPIPSDIIDTLKHYVTKSCLVLEQQAQAANLPVNTDPVIKKLGYSIEASKLQNAFKAFCNALYSNAVNDGTELEALFARGPEQAARLALVIEPMAEIGVKTAEFCIELVKHQVQAFHAQFSEVVGSTESAKESDKLLDKFITMCADSTDRTISRRDLQRVTRSWFKDTLQFSRHLQSLIEQEYIIEYSIKVPSGQTQKRLRIGAVTD